MKPFEIEPAGHRRLAASMNVQTWSLLEKTDRDEKEDKAIFEDYLKSEPWFGIAAP